MNKQRICAAVLSTAVMSAMIGCGQKNEIDQSVPDTVIDIAKTTSSTTTTSNEPYQTTSSTSGSSGSNTSSISASSSTSSTTVITTIHYAGNPNLTVRKTTEVIPETQPVTQPPTTTITTVPATEVSLTETLMTEVPSETPTEPPINTALVAPNGTFTEDDMRFTFDGVSIKPGEDSMAFRIAMQEKGILSTEWVDGFPFISYDELGIKLELIGDGLGTKAITISGTTVATEKGIHVGSTPDEVRAAYGSIYEPVSGGAIYRYLFDSNGDGENDYQMDITFDSNSLVSEITYCCLTIG